VELIARMMLLLLEITYKCVFKAPDASSSKPSTSQRQGNLCQYSREFTYYPASMEEHAGDMELFSVAYVSGSFARHVHRGVSCNACKTSCCPPMPSYISRSTVLQNSLSPELSRRW
jgi:hypothetical protein